MKKDDPPQGFIKYDVVAKAPFPCPWLLTSLLLAIAWRMFQDSAWATAAVFITLNVCLVRLLYVWYKDPANDKESDEN